MRNARRRGRRKRPGPTLRSHTITVLARPRVTEFGPEAAPHFHGPDWPMGQGLLLDVVDYDERWATQFAELRSEVQPLRSGLAVVEHIGRAWNGSNADSRLDFGVADWPRRWTRAVARRRSLHSGGVTLTSAGVLGVGCEVADVPASVHEPRAAHGANREYEPTRRPPHPERCAHGHNDRLCGMLSAVTATVVLTIVGGSLQMGVSFSRGGSSTRRCSRSEAAPPATISVVS